MNARELIARMNKNLSMCQSATHDHLIRLRRARKHAYRAAKDFNELIANHQAEFIDILEEMGFTGKDRIDKFREQHFAMVTLLGEDYNRLCACVHDGMTEKEYIDMGASRYSLNKVREKISRVVKSPLPPKPTKDLPIEEAYAQLSARHEALERKHDELLKEVRKSENRLAVVEHENNKLRRIVDKMDIALSA